MQYKGTRNLLSIYRLSWQFKSYLKHLCTNMIWRMPLEAQPFHKFTLFAAV